MPNSIYYHKNRERLIEYQKNYYRSNKNSLKKKRNKELDVASTRRWRISNPTYYSDFSKKAKTDFLAMYGNSCRCCGESIPDFLTIEHKNGQKGVHKKRKSTRAYRDAIKDYRPDLYETLCMNCNHAVGKLGYCPHTMSPSSNSNKIGKRKREE